MRSKAQFLPWRRRVARYTNPVKASSLMLTPTATWAVEPTSPAAALTSTSVVSNRPAATATSHSQKEARSCVSVLYGGFGTLSLAIGPVTFEAIGTGTMSAIRALWPRGIDGLAVEQVEIL
jgi:hypothetical protein